MTVNGRSRMDGWGMRWMDLTGRDTVAGGRYMLVPIREEEWRGVVWLTALVGG